MAKFNQSRSTFNVNFYCRDSKKKKDGTSPVEMCLIVNGERTYVSLPMSAEPVVFQRSMSSKRVNDIKSFCNAYVVRVNGIVQELVSGGIDVTSSSIKDVLMGKNVSSVNISGLFSEYLDLQRERVGKSLTLSVFRKYELVRDCFIERFGDVMLSELQPSVIQSFYTYLNGRYKSQTSSGYMSKLKTVVKYGMQNGRIKSDPFVGVRVKRTLGDVQFLTSEELERIECYESGIERIDKVRDLFLFMCYTGLSYCDMSDFSKEDVEEVEGGYMLRKRRQKTKVFYTIFLLPKAVAILDKYDWELPVISNCKMNLYLKEIADVCRIGKPLHCHIARHSFATTMLNAGLSLDFVSKTLGHSSTRLSAHYAKMLDRTVVDAMRSVSVFN